MPMTKMCCSSSSSVEEKLLGELFERKRWIVQQVKQQSHSFDQYLITNCLIKGLEPPSWLLSSSSSASISTADFKGLNKDDLISSLLLFPPPRPNHPHPSTIATATTLFTAPNHVVAGVTTTTTTSSIPNCHNILTSSIQAAAASVPQIHHANTNTSPPPQSQSQKEAKVSDKDRSTLARIHRSSSRQKALELRDSAEVKSQNHPSLGNGTIAFSARITRSTGQSNIARELLETNNSRSGPSGRLKRSKSETHQLNSVDKPSYHVVDGEDKLHNTLGSRPLSQTSTLAQKEDPMGACAEGNPTKGDVTDKCCGRTTRSQTIQVRCAKRSDKPEQVPSGRVTHSRSTSKDSQSDTRLNMIKVHHIQQASDTQFSQLTAALASGGNDKVQQERCDVRVADNDFVSCLPAESRSNRLESVMVTSFGVAKISASNRVPDDDIFVEPKQLFFDELEDCSQNGRITPHPENGKGKGSPDKARSLRTTRPYRKIVVSNDLHVEHDAQFLEKDQNLEAIIIEENLRASSDDHEEHRLGFLGVEKCERNCYSSSSREPSKLSVTPLTKGQFEIGEDVFADAFPEIHKISKGETIESLKRFDISDNTRESNGWTVDERDHTLEVLDREEERRPSPKYCEEVRCQITEGATECHFHPSSSSGEALNVSALSPQKGASEIYGDGMADTSSGRSKFSKQGNASLSSRKRKSEICGHGVAHTFSGNNKISKKGNASSDHLLVLEVGEKSSLGSQLQGNVGRSLLNLDLDPTKVGSGETCTQKLDVGASNLLTKSSEFVSVSSGPKKSTHPDLIRVTRFSLRKKHESLLRNQETECIGAADVGSRSVPTPIITPESAQISSTRREIPYWWRSGIEYDEKNSFSHSDESFFESKPRKSKKIMNNNSENSWPPYKRRKMEGESRISQRLVRVEPLHQIDEDDVSKFHGNAEDSLSTDLEFKHISSSSDVKASHSRLCRSAKRRKTERYGSSPRLQAKEDDRDMKGGEKDTHISLGLEQTGVETFPDSSLYKEEDCLSGLTDISATQLASEDHRNLAFSGNKLNLSGLTDSSVALLVPEDHQNLPSCEDLDLIAANQSIPEFTIGLSTEQLLSLSRGKISLANIDLPTSTSERISYLEKLCRSTSMFTPLPQSSNCKIQRTSDLYQSLPNGLLERMDLQTAVNFSDPDIKQLKARFNVIGPEPDLTSYSGCIPSSDFQLDRGVWKPPRTPPPVSILDRRISSVPARHSFEKQQSVNPELTCYRIDEDTSTSEENGNLDEVVNMLHGGISPIDSSTSSSRRPFLDMTNSKALPSNYVTKSVHDRGSIDSVNTESYMRRTQISAKQKLWNASGKDGRAKKDKENQCSSQGGNDVGKASESLHRLRPKLSRKASEGNKSQSFLDKGCKRANIVSNISSFIPLVQQKQQPAALTTGKRDIKVKALEAAEAARRLAEKRENDRKMKKEAAKLERARLEEERIKQLELKQKKKEEERKKKEADMAARKRQREEEDRKEKERKRKCTEEARRQQNEQDKIHAEKEEKERRRKATDEREVKKKDLQNAEQNHQKPEKVSQIAEYRTKMESGIIIVKGAEENAKKASGVSEDSEVLQEYCNKVVSNLCEANNCGFSFIEGSGNRSYDISPYQVSDDEEEEEQDVIPNKKFIPSWAREIHLASILPSMQRVDPCEIFSPTRNCSISEVLLSRLNSK